MTQQNLHLHKVTNLNTTVKECKTKHRPLCEQTETKG